MDTRIVVLRGCKGEHGEYVESVNEVFGIVVTTNDKSKARKMYLSDAVDTIKNVNNYGFHKLYAELV